MEYSDIKPLINNYNQLLRDTDCQFKRYLYSQIDWTDRLIGIKGARGVGKTTLMLQYIKENYNNYDKALYVSLDNLWFNKYDLADLVEYLYQQGVETIFLDEVHKLTNWQQYLKHCYDNYPKLKIVYTGSAMLAIDHSKADLSRRQSLYSLSGLSFREYLEFEFQLKYNPLSLSELLDNHKNMALRITENIKVLKCFNDYLLRGYYPFYKETVNSYYMRLADVAKTIIDIDIPAVEDVAYITLEKLKRLLMVISGSLPFVPNISKLAEQLQVSREHALKMLNILHSAGLVLCVNSPANSYKHLASPQKVYTENTNLMYALTQNITQGTVRETFFANQTRTLHTIEIPVAGDFVVDGRYTFEVGGNKKSYRQIADMPDSYLAVDDMEVGFGNRIPLWMFGFLY
ncbi:MAG: ATP-binding protein [Bacteroidales bacterium]|nr:ATP-binding protein [Bacteroidales bacterium]